MEGMRTGHARHGKRRFYAFKHWPTVSIPRIGSMNHLPDVLRVLDDALQLQGRSTAFSANTPLLGALPELDSMAVLAVVSGLEAHFGIAFSDDQLSGASFATVGSLCELVTESLDGTAT